jgi:hypothetical protein
VRVNPVALLGGDLADAQQSFLLVQLKGAMHGGSEGMVGGFKLSNSKGSKVCGQQLIEQRLQLGIGGHEIMILSLRHAGL